MGRKAKIIDLTAAQKTALESGFKYSKSKDFSQRCHYVLLKHQGKTSAEIGELFGVSLQVINRWCNRYIDLGIEGLHIKKGRGRKAILHPQQDAALIEAQVKQERQQLKKAKEILEEELDKSFSLKTLQRFLKKLAADGNESV